MYYLIHTPHHPRPFLTTVAFIARDFRSWNCRVDCHALDSPYITEIRLRETRINRTEWRTELMELWAREVISRKRPSTQSTTTPPTTTTNQDSDTEADSPRDRRIARASSLAQDFILALSTHGTCAPIPSQTLFRRRPDPPPTDHPSKKHTPFPQDPRPIPPSPLGLVSKYTRLLSSVRYTCSAPLPAWALTTDVLVADQIALDFRHHEVLRKEQLVAALGVAVGKGQGRMGRVERDRLTGVTRVVLVVDVGGVVLGVGVGERGEGEVDPVPVYEEVERPPAYVVVE